MGVKYSINGKSYIDPNGRPIYGRVDEDPADINAEDTVDVGMPGQTDARVTSSPGSSFLKSAKALTQNQSKIPPGPDIYNDPQFREYIARSKEPGAGGPYSDQLSAKPGYANEMPMSSTLANLDGASADEQKPMNPGKEEEFEPQSPVSDKKKMAIDPMKSPDFNAYLKQANDKSDYQKLLGRLGEAGEMVGRAFSPQKVDRSYYADMVKDADTYPDQAIKVQGIAARQKADQIALEQLKQQGRMTMAQQLAALKGEYADKMHPYKMDEIGKKNEGGVDVQTLKNEGGLGVQGLKNTGATDVQGLKNTGAKDVQGLKNQGALDVQHAKPQPGSKQDPKVMKAIQDDKTSLEDIQGAYDNFSRLADSFHDKVMPVGSATGKIPFAGGLAQQGERKTASVSDSSGPSLFRSDITKEGMEGAKKAMGRVNEVEIKRFAKDVLPSGDSSDEAAANRFKTMADETMQKANDAVRRLEGNGASPAMIEDLKNKVMHQHTAYLAKIDKIFGGNAPVQGFSGSNSNLAPNEVVKHGYVYDKNTKQPLRKAD